MSLKGETPQPLWQRCTQNYIETLPVIDFPFEQLPDVYAPASTMLRFAHEGQLNIFKWCYLRRQVDSRGVLKYFDVSSLSETRVRAMPLALERLSKWFRFKNARPSSVEASLSKLGRMFTWADQPEHAGHFEDILNDANLALEALKGFHAYIRSMSQSHLLHPETATYLRQNSIACMSEIHGIDYKDDIEPLQFGRRDGTEVPDAQLVGEFSSTLQAIFDSASDIVLEERPVPPGMLLRISATDDSKTVKLGNDYGPLRLMELACIAYTGLVFVDSGANPSVLQRYEESDDLEQQLTKPDRINLTQKAVKFRAGGKEVEVHLSATTMTRLKTYLQVRQKLVTLLGCEDIGPLFIQCAYSRDGLMKEPIKICALDENFSQYLRRKVKRIGASLPNLNFRQLRAYKQQDLVRRVPVQVAAAVMQHSVQTALKAYCKAQDSTRRGEIGEFLGSLQKTVVNARKNLPEHPHQKVIPIGRCADHGKPSPTVSSPIVVPDCSKVEGCFFCDNYRLHADENDMKKLMSCRRVLQYITPLNGDSIRAERVFTAIMDRIDSLLGELRRRQPQTFEAVRMDIEERGQLTRYWANKLQQLHLLGMLPPTTS